MQKIMTYKDLKVIDSSWIDDMWLIYDKQFEDAETLMEQSDAGFKKHFLEEIKSKMIDATPILTDCWDECQAICKCNTDMGEVMASREYLGQFLNTEINKK
jgi:hypothetical protein